MTLRTLVLTMTATLTLVGGCAYEKRSFHWTSGEVELDGTLYLPKSDGPHPVAVFIPGSGNALQKQRMPREHARHFAQRGVALLTYDKRGTGKSTGDWKKVGFTELADDVCAVLPKLAALPEIDEHKMGLVGMSQGAWVSLIAAEKCAAVSFIVNLSGGGTTPLEQGQWVTEHSLRQAGHDDSAVAEALAADAAICDVWREDTDAAWQSLERLQEDIQDKPWFKDARLAFQPRDFWNWRWYRGVMDYDPMPTLRQLQVPILFVIGEQDPLTPAAKVKRTIDALAPSAAAERTAVVLEGLRHDLRRGKGEPWPDVYWSTLDDWLQQQGIMQQE